MVCPPGRCGLLPWLKFGTVDFMAGMGRGGRVIGSREKSDIYYHYNEKSAAGMAALFRVIKLPKYNRVGVESVYSLSDTDYILQICLKYVQIIKKLLSIERKTSEKRKNYTS